MVDIRQEGHSQRDPPFVPSKRLPDWASLVAQTLKNLPAMWETWVPSLGWDDPLEEGMATHSSILGLATAHGVAKSAAAAKSLQSCPTLCDPRDDSLPGSPVPGILQA